MSKKERTHRKHKASHTEHHEHHEQHTHVANPDHAAHQNHMRAGYLEETLIHNIVQLQKVHVEMAQKFDKLASQISQLLSLFEITAKTFGQQSHGIVATEKDREFLDKIDKLLEQNKVIAKGLTLMDEKMREKVYGHSPPMVPPNMPMFPQGQQMIPSQYRPSYNEQQITPPKPLPRE